MSVWNDVARWGKVFDRLIALVIFKQVFLKLMSYVLCLLLRHLHSILILNKMEIGEELIISCSKEGHTILHFDRFLRRVCHFVILWGFYTQRFLFSPSDAPGEATFAQHKRTMKQNAARRIVYDIIVPYE